MPLPPNTTPAPKPPFMLETSATIEKPIVSNVADTRGVKHHFVLPKIRLELRDLMASGARKFLKSVVPSVAMEFAVLQVLHLLYESPKSHATHVPGTRSVTLIVRDMDGVAYTTGTDLDDDHKEIHLSSRYIDGLPESRLSDEILGVLTHEMVHCYQYNGRGKCNGGLIEGIADWVRLNCSLAPPHWKRDGVSGKWDAGYQHTAYFLEYLETRYGSGTIRRLNEKLRTTEYEEKRFWTELLGRPVDQLWDDYKASLATVEKEKPAEDQKMDERGPKPDQRIATRTTSTPS